MATITKLDPTGTDPIGGAIVLARRHSLDAGNARGLSAAESGRADAVSR